MHEGLKTRAMPVAAAVALACLTACVSTVPVKTMLDNREQFLSTYFAPAKMPLSVRQAIERSRAPEAAFKSMRLAYKIDYDEDGRKKTLSGTSIVLNAGNGLVQQQAELSNNGFPFRVNNSLNYLGLQPVIWNSGFHSRTDSQFTYELKEVKRLDKGAATAKPGDEFVFDATSGTTVQTMNYLAGKAVCKAGDPRAASTVQSKLSGQMLPFVCTAYDGNQTLLAKHEFAFLKEYGVAIPMGMSSSKDKTVYEYTDAEVTR